MKKVLDIDPIVLNNVRKGVAIPAQVLALDEIGDKEDVDAILYAIKCGVNIIATIHAGEKEELLIPFFY